MKKIDTAKVASGLGAKAISLLELTREESEQYELLGSPVMIPDGQHYLGDRSAIYHFGSQMLAQCDKSLDDVVGYRVLEADEGVEFRRKCGNESAMVVCYFKKRD